MFDQLIQSIYLYTPSRSRRVFILCAVPHFAFKHHKIRSRLAKKNQLKQYDIFVYSYPHGSYISLPAKIQQQKLKSSIQNTARPLSKNVQVLSDPGGVLVRTSLEILLKQPRYYLLCMMRGMMHVAYRVSCISVNNTGAKVYSGRLSYRHHCIGMCVFNCVQLLGNKPDLIIQLAKMYDLAPI